MQRWFRRLLTRVKSPGAYRPQLARRAKPHRLGVEHLENRRLLAVVHVSRTGMDTNPGTADMPFRTVQHAINQLAIAGDLTDDVVKVKADTFDEAGVDLAITVPASSDLINLQLLGGFVDLNDAAPTSLATYVPQQSGSVVAADVDVFNPDVAIAGFHFVFDGLPGDGGDRPSAGIISRAQDLTVRNNTIEVGAGDDVLDIDAYALQTLFNSDQGTLAILSNDIIASTDGAAPLNRSGGIYLNPGTAASVTVDGNIISGSNLSQGIVADTISNVTISNNTLSRTGPADVDFRQFIFAGPYSGAADQTNVQITGNLIQLSGVPGLVNSIGIEVGNTSTGPTSVNRIISPVLMNNIVANCTVGILVSDNTDNFSAAGDTVVSCGVGILAQATASGINNLNLTDVVSILNATDGFRAENVTGGITIDTAGGVSSFSGNLGAGIAVLGLGVTSSLVVTNVVADGNSADGLHAENVAGPVAITGSSFSTNLDDGVELLNVGDVTLNSATAIANDPGVSVATASSFSDTDGIYSDNADGGIVLADIAGDVTLVRTTANNNDFDDDGDGDGVTIITLGGNLIVQGATFRDLGGPADHQEFGLHAVDISDTSNVLFEDSPGGGQQMFVDGNEGGGVRIDDGGADATFTNGFYINNGFDPTLFPFPFFELGDGISLALFTGAVNVTSVSANFNGGDGIELLGVIGLPGPTGVLLLNTFASNNGGDGLHIADVLSPVTLSSGSFSNNVGEGIELLNVGPVDFTGVFATGNDPGALVNGAPSFVDTDGNFSSNADHGLQLLNIAGLVQLVRTTANDNDADNDGLGDGVNIDGLGGDLSVEGATLLDSDQAGAGFHQQFGLAAVNLSPTSNVLFVDSTGLV
ncbi:MAG: right-handed parallel beta-helix repeat-containing protein, partial [Planctomycetes bacterium]|nr:right-handed parallel beta-helix repeat-containing protein [Planctomycetota bacterium]